MTVELVAATFTWGGIGWLADRLIGTAPWLMLVGFVLGNATGIYLVWLRSKTEEEAEEARRRASEGRDTTPTDAQVDSRPVPGLQDGTGTDAPRP